MPRKYLSYLPFLIGALILLIALLPWYSTDANAQCGSQASSCKNCHEVQGQDQVNSDGTGWHQSHAFGDFCYICHAGNQQAMDKGAAHIGMVPPLSDIKASCQQCHTNDLETRAQVYADKLGVQIGDGTLTKTQSTPGAVVTTPMTASVPTAISSAVDTASGPLPEAMPVVPASVGMVVNDPNLVDYVQRYDEIVLGKHPTNWGNVILMVIIGLLIVGGGGFVAINEAGKAYHSGNINIMSEYSTEVVDMLPDIARLEPKALKSLKFILHHPEKVDKVLKLIDAILAEEKEKE